MTPQEKAKDLVEKYYYLPASINKYVAKQCALITVDELLYNYKDGPYEGVRLFWQEVKEEIERL